MENNLINATNEWLIDFFAGHPDKQSKEARHIREEILRRMQYERQAREDAIRNETLAKIQLFKTNRGTNT